MLRTCQCFCFTRICHETECFQELLLGLLNVCTYKYDGCHFKEKVTQLLRQAFSCKRQETVYVRKGLYLLGDELSWPKEREIWGFDRGQFRRSSHDSPEYACLNRQSAPRLVHLDQRKMEVLLQHQYRYHGLSTSCSIHGI